MADEEGRLSTDDPNHRLILLRHGETDWSRDKKHTGRTDIELNAVGERQALELAGALSQLRPELVLSSPKERARRTAELAGLSDVVTDPDLVEWDYGDFEGITTAEIREQGRPDWTIWTGGVPHGEHIEDVSRRVDRIVDRIREAITRGDVVVVGHGHANRIVAARWIELPPTAGEHLWLDTGTVCVLGFEHGHPAILRWNLPPASAGEVL
ncbi:MAG: histidine phosphatase family protein [Mycobacteriales bacterium]